MTYWSTIPGLFWHPHSVVAVHSKAHARLKIELHRGMCFTRRKAKSSTLTAVRTYHSKLPHALHVWVMVLIKSLKLRLKVRLYLRSWFRIGLQLICVKVDNAVMVLIQYVMLNVLNCKVLVIVTSIYDLSWNMSFPHGKGCSGQYHYINSGNIKNFRHFLDLLKAEKFKVKEHDQSNVYPLGYLQRYAMWL